MRWVHLQISLLVSLVPLSEVLLPIKLISKKVQPELIVETETYRGGSALFLEDRVFVGAGAIGSTRLMLESMHLHGEPCVLKQSHKFVLPLLRRPPVAADTDAPASPAACAATPITPCVSPQARSSPRTSKMST